MSGDVFYDFDVCSMTMMCLIFVNSDRFLRFLSTNQCRAMGIIFSSLVTYVRIYGAEAWTMIATDI